MHEISSILAGPGLTGVMQVEQRGGIAQLVEHIKLTSSDSAHRGPSNSYATVATVYSCVRIKAECLSRMLLMVSDRDGNAIESGPLVKLAENPNPQQTGRKFWRDTEAFLDLFGRFHWWFLLDSIGRPVEVHAINPAQMTPVLNRATGELIAWKFRAAGAFKGTEEIIPVDEVYTYTDPDHENPDRPWEGLSPRAVAMRAIRQIYKAALANESSLDNGVEPGGVFTMEGVPTPAQLADARSEINERHAGVQNRRRNLLLVGGMKFESMGASFADAEFTELVRLNQIEVCAAFQVPPACVGYYQDSNYAHADAAEQSLWIRTIIPRGELLAEEWTTAVLSRFSNDRSLGVSNARRAAVAPHMRRFIPFIRAGTVAIRRELPYFAWFDSSQVPAVQQNQLSLSKQIGEWINNGVPLNDCIETFGLLFAPQAWGDTVRVSVGTMDIRNDTQPGATDPDFSEPAPASEEAGESPESGEGDGGGKGRRASACGTQRDPAQTKANDAAMGRLWQKWRASWAGLEKALYKKIRRHFYELRGQVMAKFNELAPLLAPPESAETPDSAKAIRQKAEGIIGRILFDIVVENGKLVAKAGPYLRESIRLGGEQSMQEGAIAQGKDEKDAAPFNMKAPEVEAAMRRKLVKVTGANRTLQKKLADELADGIREGETIAEMRDRIARVFNVADTRATTIARTEVHGSVEAGRHEGRLQAGIPLKSWLWSKKKEGRALHAATEAATRDKPIPAGENFTIAGTSVTCPYPGATGDPAHDINCACTVLSRFPNDPLKAVIARYEVHGFLDYDGLRRLDAMRAKS